MSALWWLLVPMTPLAGVVFTLLWQDRVYPWLWLTTLPALLFALVPALTPEALDLGWLWPGAAWYLDDVVGRAFLGFSALLWAAASLYGVSTQSQHPQRERFWIFWLVSLAGNLLLIIAQDGASFYVGFTLMSLAAYALVVHLGGPGPRQAGRIYLQLAIAGELMIYAALMLRIHESGGALDLASWQAVHSQPVTMVLLIIGFGLKAGFWPLHVWLPLAHPAAPAAASAVLSGAMIKAGILGLWRFLPEGDPLLQTAAPWLIGIGMFSAFYGVILGLMQTQAKSALAFSSVSQVGYLLAILALSWLAPEHSLFWGALLATYVVHHGFAKGALFMGAGLAKVHPLRRVHWLLLAVPALALAGLPLTSGGAAKQFLKDGFYEAGLSAWIPMLTVGGIGTFLLLVRVLVLIRQHQVTPDTPRAPNSMFWPWVTISLMPLLAPALWPTLRLSWFNSLVPVNAWPLLWPLLLAATIGGIALYLNWRPSEHWMHRMNSASSPARKWSLALKHQTQRPALRQEAGRQASPIWRQTERQWNRFWQRETVSHSAWVITALLILLGLWQLIS